MTLHLKRINGFGNGNGGGGGGGGTTGEYFVKVIDYDGTVLDEQWLDDGAEYTLPENPDRTDKGLVFQEWSCSQDIVNGKVTIDKGNVVIGAIYKTVSGYDEFDIELTQATGKTFYLYGLPSETTRDWGDGTTDTNSSHTYTDYGKYTIKLNAISFSDRTNTGVFGQNSGYSNINFSVTAIRLNNITSIGNKSFHYCHSLKYVSFAKNTTKIGTDCLLECRGLRCIIIPNSITQISNNAFYDCYSVENLVIPKDVVSIGSSSFNSLYSLSFLVLPKNLQTINSNGFKAVRCKGLVKIPSTVTSIGNYAFNECFSIEKIDMSNANVTFGSSGYIFKSCYGLKEVINFGNVTNLPVDIFDGCTALKEIVIPEGITSISGYAFNYCVSLSKVVIPKTVASIDSRAFAGATNILEYDFSHFETIPTIADAYVFNDINKICKIKVPAALYDSWIVATNWSALANLIVAV